jgi:signal transduction histidine kinase/CheY-like chemotaxis protein
VVWVVFNSLIAFMLMEMNVFQALGDVLGLYSNIAIAWIMAVVADLVINKPLGLSPKGIEFKRAHLYDINPVGVGAMALASLLSIAAYLGVFGAMAQAFSALVALVTAMLASPFLAWMTKGRYYIARDSEQGSYSRLTPQRCVICERSYEGPDMAHCPAYQGPICSLCCTLDARCGDACKPHASLAVQWSGALRWLLPRATWPYLDTGLSHFVLLMGVIVPLLVTVFAMFYRQELASFDGMVEGQAVLRAALQSGFSKAFAALMLLSGIVAWWLVLAHKSRQVAQEESNRQTHLLMREIELHRQTDRALQAAKALAEQAKLQAEQANAAKSRYISAISHELRTPLNSILGYAQLMGQDAGIPPHRKQAVSVILRGGDHLLSLMEGTLEMAQIESGKLVLAPKPLQFEAAMADMADMFELQASDKGLAFHYTVQGPLPEWVKADDKRLRQICFNLLGNAIKFTQQGSVSLRVRYAREMAHIEIHDTGPGMTAAEVERVYEPFVRGDSAAHGSAGSGGSSGSGLGLTIAKMLTDLMGGELQLHSVPGEGSVFSVRLFLPQLHVPPAGAEERDAKRQQRAERAGYVGTRRKILVVDNEAADRDLLLQLLQPLGFELRQAASGHDCLDLLAAGLNPDVVFLDLAMPGIDGWETLRRIRALGAPQPAVAIVSANAFDRALDHGLGIAAEDFIVKPVRHSELLDWLERRLQLVWVSSAHAPLAPLPEATPPALETSAAALPRTELRALQSLVQLGYFRGITNQLNKLLQTHPQCAPQIKSLDALARQYQFETMLVHLQKALDAAHL